jgi:hypothetical protein
MALDIRVCQFFRLVTAPSASAPTGVIHRYQNYFANEAKLFRDELYDFAPFRGEGSMASLNGENEVMRILFPNVEFAVQLLSQANGNRLSVLTLTTQWLTADNAFTGVALPEYCIGIGASLSETTIELRFRSSIDSVTSNFPGRTLTRELVGPLPLDSQLYLQ